METQFKHIRSLLLLCVLWVAFVMMNATAGEGWYSVRSEIDIAKTIVATIFNAALISTAIIVVMLHRVRSAIMDTDKSIKDADTSIQNIGASIDKLNERIKTVARMIDDIKDIEQKISERPPVVIQKKESNQ